jgi:hypothetical protein
MRGNSILSSSLSHSRYPISAHAGRKSGDFAGAAGEKPRLASVVKVPDILIGLRSTRIPGPREDGFLLRPESLLGHMRGALALVILVGSVALASGTASVIAQPHRQLGAHQHGQGRLDITIMGANEGGIVSMALEVPASDIVGFEHTAAAAADQAKVDAAKVKLSNPLALFEVPAAASCAVEQAVVNVQADATTGHAEFTGEYTLKCADVTKLTAIAFPYFKAFKGSHGLKVSLITPGGQTSFDVAATAPRIAIPAPK